MKRPLVTGCALILLFSTATQATHPKTDPDSPIHCTVAGNDVNLSWNVVFVAPIEGWVVARDGVEIAKLPSGANSFSDQAAMDGEHTYEVSAINFDGSIIAIGQCVAVVGNFGLRCRTDELEVAIEWGPILIDVHIEAFVIRRDGEIVDIVPAETLAFSEGLPHPGVYRYTVRAVTSPGHDFVVGACTVRLRSPGFVCHVTPPTVTLDWSAAPIPEIALAFFLVERDGDFIATTLDTTFVDAPGPGTHTYAVHGIPVFAVPPGGDDALDAIDLSLGFLVGECKIVLPGDGVPPPQELTCIDLDLPPFLRDVDVGFVGEHDVLLVWQKPLEYDWVIIARNYDFVALIPGSQRYFLDRNVLPGNYTYRVFGVLGSSISPPASCEVALPRPPVPPPRNLRCTFIGALAGGDTADVHPGFVDLNWENGGDYERVVLLANGEELVQLPGNSTGYRDHNPRPGKNTYSVFGAVGLRRSRAAQCEVEVRIGPPPAPQELTCALVLPADLPEPVPLPVPEPFAAVAAQGEAPPRVPLPPGTLPETTVSLSWVNPVRYDSLLIYRNDLLVTTLAGDREQYFDHLPLSAQGRVHEYAVVGQLGKQDSPKASCRVRVPGSSPRDILSFSPRTFPLELSPDEAQVATDEALVPPGDGRVFCVASHSAPLQGWSFGVCSDPRFLQVAGATIEGTTVAALNDGQGPSFLVIDHFEEGVTLAAIVDEADPTDTLEAANADSLLSVHYEAGPDALPGGRYPVRYCDTLGAPPVAVIYVVEGLDVRPATLGGTVALPPDPSLFLLRADANGDEAVDMSDALFILNWLFLGGPEPGCLEQADVNASGDVNLADAVFELQWEFSGGPPPPPPFPECGPDPAALGCVDPACPQPVF